MLLLNFRCSEGVPFSTSLRSGLCSLIILDDRRKWNEALFHFSRFTSHDTWIELLNTNVSNLR